MAHAKKIAVVTGANRGIGFEICRQLLLNGFHVVLTARDPIKGLAATKKLALDNSDIEFFKLDVNQPGDINALQKHITNTLKRCDVLINNAGIFPDPRDDLENNWPSILSTDINNIQNGIDCNTFGTLRMCQALIPIMQENNYGRIVNLSSGMAQLSDMNGCCPGYRISKAAINVITRIIADELNNTNILINSMCPGWVKTEMGGPGATRDLADGADTAIWLAELSNDGPNGLFFRDRKVIPW